MAIDFNASELIASLGDGIEQDIQETALASLRNVVQASPVGDPDTWQNPDGAPPGYVGGHMRRNWVVSLDAFSNVIRGTEGKGGGKAAATSEAINQGSRRIEQSTKRTRRIILQNNVPYANRLNNGWSEQAPVNFVEMAVAAAVNVGRNERRPV